MIIVVVADRVNDHKLNVPVCADLYSLIWCLYNNNGCYDFFGNLEKLFIHNI